MSPIGLRQLVHGTFMTKTIWHVRTSAGRELLVKADAMRRANQVDVLLLPKRVPGAPPLDIPRSMSAGEVQVVEMNANQRIVLDDVAIETHTLSVSVESPAWSVNVTSKPIYGLVQVRGSVAALPRAAHYSPMPPGCFDPMLS